MTSKTELIVIVPSGYQPLNSRWCPKSRGFASIKILLLSDVLLLEGEDRKTNAIHISGSSSLLVDRISEKFVQVKNCNYLTNYGLCWLKWSGVCEVYYYIRDNGGKKWIAHSTSLPQLHIRLSLSWKLCLNLCSHKWLSPRQRRRYVCRHVYVDTCFVLPRTHQCSPGQRAENHWCHHIYIYIYIYIYIVKNETDFCRFFCTIGGFKVTLNLTFDKFSRTL